MNRKLSRELSSYFRQIRLLMPVFTRREKQFLRMFRERVLAFAEESETCDLQAVIRRFGTPRDVVSNYLDSMDTSELFHHLSAWRMIRRVIVIIMLLVILTVEVQWGMVEVSRYICNHHPRIVTTLTGSR